MQQEHFTIAEVAEITGYHPHVIRYYEKEFNLKIPRNKSNHRYFTQNEINVLRQIKHLQEKGYSNPQIKMIMQSPETARQMYYQLESIAVTKHEISDSYNKEGYNERIESILLNFKKDIIEELKKQLQYTSQPFIIAITELVREINELTISLKDKDNYIEFHENEKLRAELAQKNQIINELRELLEKERERSQNFFGKVFKK